MMEIQLRVISSIGVILMLISGVILLKRLGILEARFGPVCSRLITGVTLPAVILVSLTHSELQWSYGELALMMMAITALCLGLGWVIARIFRLERPSAAAVILTSGFCSSSLLGFTLIADLFPGDDRAMAEAVIISGLGVQPLLFSVGVLIAQYGGTQERSPKARREAVLAYFRSPIFIALVSGLVLALVTEHTGNPIVHSVLDGLRSVSAGNTLMVVLSVGLVLDLRDFGKIAGLAICVGAVNLVIMPLLMTTPAHAMGLPHWQVQVLILQASMPAAMLSVVLCDAYGANARLAAQLVVATTVASVATVPVISWVCNTWA